MGCGDTLPYSGIPKGEHNLETNVLATFKVMEDCTTITVRTLNETVNFIIYENSCEDQNSDDEIRIVNNMVTKDDG